MSADELSEHYGKLKELTLRKLGADILTKSDRIREQILDIKRELIGQCPATEEDDGVLDDSLYHQLKKADKELGKLTEELEELKLKIV